MANPVPRRSEWNRRLATPGWGLLPLRAFLGATFVFAGLQKLADRNFFRASSPSSIQSQLHAYAHSSPVGGLLGGAVHLAVPLGILIALAEIAIGAGALLGLWTRAAAVGGALLSLGFLLTVSWHSRPYYYGADIVFLVAWLPLVIVGDGGVLSLAARTRERTRRELGAPVVGPVSIEFTAVRSLCGAYDSGRCTRRNGEACEPTPCPVLRAGPRPPSPLVQNLDRRAFLATARAATVVAAAAAGLGVVAGTVGRLAPAGSTAARLPDEGELSLGVAGTQASTTATGPPPSSAASTTTGSPGRVTPTPDVSSSTSVAVRPRGTPIGAAANIAAGGGAGFTDPATGQPAYVVRGANGDYRAFSAVCTHAGCTVQLEGSEFTCPCHGARFSASDGSATQGPARSPLAPISVAVGSDGQLYAG